MRTNIFIPEKINVGYQERRDTYTGKLAYVIYFDAKGKLRKENSWNGWRTHALGNDIYENKPMSGFVLNKKAGGYSSGWNHRQSYVRIYDPRGFEFEITIPNLLYILENSNSIKGKGLEGEFVYGWDGKDHLLVPVDSPDYKEILEKQNAVDTNVYLTPKQFIVGGTHVTKEGKEYIYLGKHDEYGYNGEKMKTKSFYFAERYDDDKSKFWITTMKSVAKKFVSIADAELPEDFDKMIDKMESSTDFSPIDATKAVYTPYTFDEFERKLKGGNNWFYDDKGKKLRIYGAHGADTYIVEEVKGNDVYWYDRYINIMRYVPIQQVFENMKPSWRTQYLANGRLYREEK